MKKDEVIKTLMDLGFKLEEIDERAYSFSYEAKSFLYIVQEDDPDFLLMMAPNIFDEKNKDELTLYKMVNEFNNKVKYVKACLAYHAVSLTYERMLMDDENLEDVLRHIIVSLDAGVCKFWSDMERYSDDNMNETYKRQHFLIDDDDEGHDDFDLVEDDDDDDDEEENEGFDDFDLVEEDDDEEDDDEGLDDFDLLEGDDDDEDLNLDNIFLDNEDDDNGVGEDDLQQEKDDEDEGDEGEHADDDDADDDDDDADDDPVFLEFINRKLNELICEIESSNPKRKPKR